MQGGRPSPAESATLYKIGTKKKGSDGNRWIVVSTVRGSQRWVRYSPENNNNKGKSFDFYHGAKLKPFIARMSNYDKQTYVVFKYIINLCKPLGFTTQFTGIVADNFNYHKLAYVIVNSLEKERKDTISGFFEIKNNIIVNSQIIICWYCKTDTKFKKFEALLYNKLQIKLTNTDKKYNFCKIQITP